MEGKEEGVSNNNMQKPNNTENELHVKGLLFESTEEQIQAHFEKFGKVNSINLLKGQDGKSKGIAFVRMEDEKGVTEGIAHSGEEFMGRKIFIDKSKTREERYGNSNYGGYKNNNNYGGYNNRYGQQNRNKGNFNNNNNNYDNELVVKGLSYDSTEDDIWNYFDNFGKVRSINLLKRQDGSSKGIAFVRMATRGGFFKAESNNGEEFMGRQVWINNANKSYGNNNYQNKNYNNNYNNNNYNNNYNNRNNYGNQGNFNGPKKVHKNQTQTIFVGNLSWNTTTDMLKETFEPCGKVADVRIARKPDGRSRGFAYVEFETEESVKKALEEMTGTKVDGREINIDASKHLDQAQESS